MKTQMTSLQSAAHDEAVAWYKDTFAGIDADSMPLPDVLSESAASAPAVVRTRTATLAVDADALGNRSRELGVTVGTLCGGAFAYMAGVWNAADECLLSIADGEQTVVPAYCQWTADTTVANFLTALAGQTATARSHAEACPYDEACELTGIAPRLMFAFGDSAEPMDITDDTLLFALSHRDGKLELTVTYQTTAYTDAFIDSMTDTYAMVLGGFIACERLADIQFCSAEMTARLEALNHAMPAATDGETIVSRFRRIATEQPSRIALKDDERQMTYGEVHDRACRLAACINGMGLGEGDIVGVLVGRNEFMLTATMGVLYAGAAYEPLDSSYPPERLNYMMRDAAVRLLVKDRDVALELEDDLKASVRVLCTDEIAALEVGEWTAPAVAPESPFILLYTSGTTGLPKGVILTHANLMALYRQQVADMGVEADSRWAMYASYGFDAGFFSLLVPMCAGASVTIVPEDVRLDLDELNCFVVRNEVDTMFMTTQVGRIFHATVGATTVRRLIVGGERLVPCAPRDDMHLYNIYGPTECAVYCHYKRVDDLYRRVPVGMHLTSFRNYIVDALGRRMPLGAMGEMLVAGGQVGRGYLNLPEKTASVFRPNPFCDEAPYDRLYHTGDIARLLPATGEGDIIGRNDGQVKIRGFRVELPEVEMVVREFPDVKDATVQAFDAPAGGKFIAAYVVADTKIDIDALRAFVGERKPPYMIPAVVMQIDTIPLTRNQKVDRRALPEPRMDEAASRSTIDRKPNLLEQKILDIVAEILGTADLPLDMPLAYAGLTSISAMRLAAQVFRRFGVNLKGAELMKSGTVLTIEDAILERLLSADAPKEERTEALASAPLSVSQQGVYADTMRSPGALAYNIAYYLRFDASTDTAALAAAVVRIVNAHPYLRDVCLALGDDDVEQTVAGGRREVSVPVTHMTEDEAVAYRRTFVRAHDLMQAPLHRFEVVATEQAVYLFLDVHHIVFDGTSLTIFFAQLKTLLEGGEIEDERYTYLDYAQHERQWLANGGGAASADFFKRMLASCEAASDIPADKRAGDGGATGGRLIATPIDAGRVEAFCRRTNLTPAALYLAATGYATARFCNARSAFISTISTGRSDNRFGDTFGMFVKTVPVAIEIADSSALDFARRAAATLADVVANEMYPYARICADYNYAPNIMYEYQRGVVEDFTVNGRPLEYHTCDLDSLKFKIAVRVDDIEGVPSVVVHFDQALYSEAFMRSYCDAIAMVAEAIMDSSKRRVRTISMVTDAERERLNRFATSDMADYSDLCLHNLMEEQAARHPGRKAVVACDRTLTYAELDRLSNIVANNLIAKGVKRGDKVMVLLSRTSRFFSTVYGVMKAGAAFIPSSPDYPEERRRSIAEDSQAACIVTDDNVDALHEGADDSRPAIAVTPDDLAYLIYTSGSTGKPKGVLLRHRGIVNYMTPVPSVPHAYAVATRCHAVGGITTVAFDLSFKEWGFALSHGLTLVFANDEQTNDPIALASLFRANGVDCLNSTPSRVLQYLDLDDFRTMLAGCKAVICGGELYPTQLLARLREIAPDAQFFNTYGPTEITVSSNVCDLTSAEEISVGHPLRNYVETIVDLDDNPVPVGVTGELLISGGNIALGYNNNPEQTAKAFVTYNGLPTYRSGDFARWADDGTVVVLGRKDTQVKLRGLRIELGEIERVLTAIKGVSMAHIMIRKVGGRENLVAYYVASPGFSFTDEEIKARMGERLTEYMVPSFVMALDKMPTTPNGKINTRELPEPQVARREAGQAAANELEQMFVDVFKTILDTDAVYADDSFFALGGTSLTATRVMIAAAKAGHRIVYADVFANPTPAALARLVESRRTDATAETQDEAMAALIQPGYDYTRINNLLRENTLDNFRQGKLHTLGTVLLTGATGFAGIHVLRELLTNYDMEVVCLCRSGRDGQTAEDRLERLFFYYFSESLAETYSDRLRVVRGDITLPDTFGSLEGIDTVINCAANVKHFSVGTDIEDINYYGVLKLIDFCHRTGARLIQTSTHSVCGQQPESRNDVLSECDLYIGQDFNDNKYVISKFAAERAVLEAVARGEIVGKVVRLGNLAPREVDGEFQINASTNGFMNRLKSLYLTGCFPYSSYDTLKDISPIDDVARAIVLFARTPDKCVLFYGNNFNRVSLGNFYAKASAAGLGFRAVETDEYTAALDRAKADPAKLSTLVGLVAYEGVYQGMHDVDYTNAYSNQVLLRMGFRWPIISDAYISKTIDCLVSLGFFYI